MKYKKSMIMLVLVIFIFGVASVCASDVNDTVIAGEDDSAVELPQADGDEIISTDENELIGQAENDEPISEGNSGTFAELQAYINAAGSTLTLNKSYECEDGFDSEGILIDKTITIDGQGFKIDAQEKSRIFKITADNVVLKNIIFTNGKTTGNGGAVYFEKSGTVTNCNFTGNSAYDGGAVYSKYGFTDTVKNCNFANNSAKDEGGAIDFGSSGVVENCNFTNNSARYGGVIKFETMGIVTKCNFTNNQASSGGAIFFNDYSTGNVINCNFTNNQASIGGAIEFGGSGSVTNCSFTDNTAVFGGAIEFGVSGSVTNCNFTDNKANEGSAIHFYKYNSANTLTISNSILLNNRAYAEALDVVKNENNIIITFTGENNLLNAIYSNNNVTFTNVTYWGAKGITTISSIKSGSNKAAGQNITVRVVVNDKLVLNEVKVTDENGTIVLDITAGDNYYITVRHDADSYYTEAEKTVSNMTFYVNVTETETTNRTVNITAESNIPNDVVKGELLFILPNGANITANYAGNGIWWAEHTFDVCGSYVINATYIGLDNVTVRNATININKMKTLITGKDVTSTYNDSKYLVITLKDENGKPLVGVNVTVKLKDAKTLKTDKNGQVKISIKGLDPNKYAAKITFNGDSNYIKSTKSVTVTVKKAKPKIIAKKKKTYRAKAKTKKLKITLKDNTGKPIKNAKVRLIFKKIGKGSKKKTIIAKTNKNGKATFKVKINKKAKYLAYVKFYANKHYMKTVKKIKITIK